MKTQDAYDLQSWNTDYNHKWGQRSSNVGIYGHILPE